MVLGAFLVGVVLFALGVLVAALRGIRLWRQAKRTGGAFASELASFEARSARTERHLAEWERANERLEAALARLRVSRARLAVLQDAVAQAQSRTRWLRVFVPW